MLEIELQSERLFLLPERAVWWPVKKTLIVSDLHWGKTAHFRKHGIAIPAEAQPKDEMRLAMLIRNCGAERLIIAGDLFHSKTNIQVEDFTHFREAHYSLHIDLVIGNHDILPEEKYLSWNLSVHKDLLIEKPFCIAHDAFSPCNHFMIHGHVHPSVSIKSKGRHQSALRLCCFATDDERMILPAFGQFTGTYRIEPRSFRHVYVIAENTVMQWK